MQKHVQSQHCRVAARYPFMGLGHAALHFLKAASAGATNSEYKSTIPASLVFSPIAGHGTRFSWRGLRCDGPVVRLYVV